MNVDSALPGHPPVWLLKVLPVAGTLAVAVLWSVWRRGYWGVVAEDSLAEWLTFLTYAVAAVLAAVMARRLVRQGLRAEFTLFVLLTAAVVFIAGEEVSWFQRQIGFAGPAELVARNVQGEANLHNLLTPNGLHSSYIIVGLYGGVLARHLVPHLPILKNRPWLYVPPRALASWFGVAWVYYMWAVFFNAPIVDLLGPSADIVALTGPKLQEVVELFLAGGIMLFLVRLVTADEPGPGLLEPRWGADAARSRLRMGESTGLHR